MKHIIKGIVATLALALIMSAGWWKYRAFLTEGMQPTAGTKRLNAIEKSGVPDFEMVDIKGRKVSLSQYKDKTVILNFWASWCEPCIQEFPSMLKLVEFFKGQVVLIAVSADQNQKDMEVFLKPFAKQMPQEVVIIFDKDKTLPQLYGTEVLPESFILAKGLRLVRKVAGSEDWFSPGAVQLFNQIVSTSADQALPTEEASSNGSK
jgi:cytochrome c biogenesis protein CcmG, thiol:disulfide interchange protein DsbE